MRQETYRRPADDHLYPSILYPSTQKGSWPVIAVIHEVNNAAEIGLVMTAKTALAPSAFIPDAASRGSYGEGTRRPRIHPYSRGVRRGLRR